MDLLRSRLQGLAGHDRVIVYCMTRQSCIDAANAVSTALPETRAHSYHGSMTQDTKVQALQNWRSGKCKVICATSAFDAGIDYAHVRLVVHISGSASVLDYAQETGRAGRDGQQCRLYTPGMQTCPPEFP
ncbi:hypothetical protein LRAMOSA09480 [Lichtheimia ramosa]|uniref:DNA 3'-5' helicase n=1 Tax=Lichtheimia ramosa TaxID=688394 RepID=A0A077WK49_9FUNG|nr:hypothetical protein LRAMOSA09480 [Lichtheimia ramosa]